MAHGRTSTGSPDRRAARDRRAACRLALAAALLAGVAPVVGVVHAAGAIPGLEAKLLPPDQAFRLSARALDPQTIEARFDVADGYYLYRDKLRFGVSGGNASGGAAALPAGKRKRDEFFGDVETYRGALVVRVPVVGAAPGQAVILTADSQGCADAGVCYPPSTQQLRLALPAAGAGPGPIVEPEGRKRGLFN